MEEYIKTFNEQVSEADKTKINTTNVLNIILLYLMLGQSILNLQLKLTGTVE